MLKSSNYILNETILKALTLLLLSFFLLPTLIHAKTLEKVSLQLQWKHQFEYAGFYAAIEKGFYKDEGLEVELKEIHNGMDPIEEILLKRADYALVNTNIIKYYAEDKPIVMVANFFKHSALVLISQKEIMSPADLAGKRIMGSLDELKSAGITMLLNRFELSLDDMTVVEHNYNLDAFINKEVDVTSAFISNEPYLLDHKNVKYNILNPASYGTQLYDVNLFTTKVELKEHPKRVEAFKRASIKGWEYALKNSDEIIKLILKKYNTLNKTKESLEYEAKITKDLISPSIYEIGSIDCNVVKNLANNLIRHGDISKDINLDFKEFILNQDCSTTKSGKFTADEKLYLKTKKEIKVCVDPDWMPFEKLKGTKHIGMSADYLKIVESIIDVKFRVIPTKSWNESIKFAKERKCDILSLAMQTPERKKFMNFTKPYISIPLIIATNHDKVFISNIEDVLDKKLGITKGYAYAEILKSKYPSINLIEVDSTKDGLKKLANGKLYGFIDNMSTIAYQIQKNYIGTLKIAGQVGENWELGIGIRNDDPLLFSILDKAIGSIDEKSRQNILNQWVSINYEKGFDYSVVRKMIVITTVILLIILIRYRIIQKYNKKMRKYIDIVDKNVLISSTDIEGKITEVSEALCNISGYTKDELIGKNHRIFKHPDSPKELYEELWLSITNGKNWSGEMQNKKKNGSYYWASVIINPIFEEDGEISGFTAIRQDISDKKYAQKLAVTDTLTQISNRLHLQNCFKEEINRAKRYKTAFSVILLDIDFFKAVNDTHGHDIGDKVLISIVNILKNNIRDTDILGRWGGEEFLIICPESNSSQVETVAQKLRTKIEEFTFYKAGKLTCSFGISEFKTTDINSSAMVKRADNALYEAKNTGRNKVVVSSE